MTLIESKFKNIFEPALIKELETCPIMDIPKGVVMRNEAQNVLKYTPLVLSGSISSTRVDDEGREVFLYHIRTAESCFLSITASLNDNFSNIKNLKATTDEDTKVVTISDRQIRDWHNRYRTFRDFVSKLYNRRFLDIFAMVDNIVFKSIEEKLTHKLKELQDKNGEIALTHKDLAIQIGTAREVVSRTLKQWERSGKVALSRGKIKIILPL
jgi:CRP/FNR family transcriptional regulator, anaerobic regulatory protein